MFTVTCDAAMLAGSNCSCASTCVKRPVQCEKPMWLTRNSRLVCALSTVYAPAGTGAGALASTATASGATAARMVVSRMVRMMDSSEFCGVREVVDRPCGNSTAADALANVAGMKKKPAAQPQEPALNAGAQESDDLAFGLPPAPEPGTVPGIDTPLDTTAQLSCLTAAGKRFVARYYARGNRPKIIRRAEAQAISGAGLGIVAVWESGFPTTVDYFARAQGNADGADAHQRATEIGQPRDTPIYFAVDYDADPAHAAGPILEYFRGIAAGLTAAAGGTARYTVGCYGSGIVCGAIQAAGLARFTWLAQSRGWRGYAGFTTWNIRQGPVSRLCALDVDGDEARHPFGEFRVV